MAHSIESRLMDDPTTMYKKDNDALSVVWHNKLSLHLLIRLVCGAT